MLEGSRCIRKGDSMYLKVPMLIAREVLNGRWGDENHWPNNVEKEGYDCHEIQRCINSINIMDKHKNMEV